MDDTTRLTIKLNPGAKSDSIALKDDGTVNISVTSRPIGGKANEHLIKLVSKTLRIPKSSCEIITGNKSRIKVVAIRGVRKEEIYFKFK